MLRLSLLRLAEDDMTTFNREQSGIGEFASDSPEEPDEPDTEETPVIPPPEPDQDPAS
jgi:hypothetical protein